MNILKRLGTLILVVFFLWGIPYVLVCLGGKPFIERRFEDFIGRDISIGSMRVYFPYRILMSDISIDNIAVMESVEVIPQIASFVTGKAVFESIKIIKPVINYERGTRIRLDKEGEEPQARIVTGAAIQMPTATPRYFFPLVIKHLFIQDGIVHFSDYSVKKEGLLLSLKDLSLSIGNIYSYTYNVSSDFSVKGNVPWEEGQKLGRIYGEGSINFFKKEIQAYLRIEDINARSLQPYYADALEEEVLEKARIGKVIAKFSWEVSGFNNVVTNRFRLELTDVERPPAGEGPPEREERIADVILDTYKLQAVEFSNTTSFDAFTFFVLGDVKSAVEEKLHGMRGPSRAQQALKAPGKVVGGVLSGVGEVSNAVVSGTISIGREIFRGVFGSFRREKR
jgi:hypothetical protein